MVLEISSKDYNNLRTDYSDPNIINRVQGSEFLIDDASVVDFYFNNNPSQKEYAISVPISLNTNELKYYSYSLGKSGANIQENQVVWGREEFATISGTFSAKIDQVVFSDSISIEYDIDYDSYQKTEKDLINSSNYKQLQYVFNSINNLSNMINKDESDNRIPQVINNSTIFNGFRDGYIYYEWRTGFLGRIVNKNGILFTGSVPGVSTDIKITSIDKNELGETLINVSYSICVWYGYTKYQKGSNPEEWENLLRVARSIKFKVRANTINTTENTFDYGDSNEDPYALESNEFLQYQNGEPLEDRMSYETAQEIFEKTERNRMLVSFNLFRLDKLDWDGDGNLRFIRSRDRIKIKDELGNYLGIYYDSSGNEIIPEFEVVRANGKWDGKFYKEIIAKQVFT